MRAPVDVEQPTPEALGVEAVDLGVVELAAPFVDDIGCQERSKGEQHQRGCSIRHLIDQLAALQAARLRRRIASSVHLPPQINSKVQHAMTGGKV